MVPMVAPAGRKPSRADNGLRPRTRESTLSSGDTYAAKRSFADTPEPAADIGNVDPGRAVAGRTFVIHQHHARRLHFDLRLEMMNGDLPVLVSWAVPKGLPVRKGKPHLAVHVEDHPIEYGSFSGTIPAGNYGAGEVRIFDSGTYEVLEQSDGKLTFRLDGARLRGEWHLFRTRSGDGSDDWLVALRALDLPERDPPPELSPMLATLVREPFDGDDWLFEIKWDGVRALAVCTDEDTTLLSRNHRDITATYPELARLHTRLVALDAVVDGEIVALSGGRPSFEQLQARMNLQDAREIERMVKRIPVSYVAFDLLYLDGRSLLERPLEERLELLREVVVADERVQVSQPVPGDGVALFEIARQRRLEGVVAKRRRSPYRPGRRTKEWLKVKTVYECDLVVGGWSRGEGSRASSFGALLVGAYTDDGLRFVGAVGTGYSERVLDDLVPRLRALETEECPFLEGPAGIKGGRFGKPIRGARWVRPELVARIEFRELTSQGKLRAPSYKGLVDSGEAQQCRFDELATT